MSNWDAYTTNAYFALNHTIVNSILNVFIILWNVWLDFNFFFGAPNHQKLFFYLRSKIWTFGCVGIVCNVTIHTNLYKGTTENCYKGQEYTEKEMKFSLYKKYT